MLSVLICHARRVLTVAIVGLAALGIEPSPLAAEEIASAEKTAGAPQPESETALFFERDPV